MQTGETQLIHLDGWPMRLRLPATPSPHPLILMLHGWTGDENAMWIFAARLPAEALLVAPRGLYPSALGGYGWHPEVAGAWSSVSDFRPAAQKINEILIPENFPSADFSSLRLVGFSQGAALAFVYALLYPAQVKSLAGLSGFLPDGAGSLVEGQPLRDRPIFMAHGTRDELVPVERARRAADLLRQAGAQVHYCEDDVGHKLSLDCFRALQTFFEHN